jgi:fatty acid desaturase
MQTTTPRLAADELKALSVRSDRRGTLRLAGHLGALGVTGTLVMLTRGTGWIVPAIVVHGYVLSFLFCALHETTHYTPFRSRWPNTALGHFCGFLLLLPFEAFRLFHWNHHRFTQDPRRDPELARPKPGTLLEYVVHVSGLPNWKTRIAVVGRYALLGRVEQPWIPEEERPLVVREARAYVLGYGVVIAASIGLHSAVLLWLWVLPALAGQIFLRNYLLAEHTGCAEDASPYANTRTTYSNAIVRFFAWNMPYHVEHHAYPAIPFHALPQANERLRTLIQVADRGYLAALYSILSRLHRGHAPQAD